MADKRVIRGDIDKVYDDATMECVKIASYIYSKGDIETKRLSNKFSNVEILKKGILTYLVTTSGRLGAVNNSVVVRRFNSEVIVKKAYLEKCKEYLQEGYNEVEVVSIYPNCSATAKEFVAKSNVLEKDVAASIVKEKKEKLGSKVDIKPTSVSTFTVSPQVKKFVDTLYHEANVSIKQSLNPQAFQTRSTTPLGMINIRMINKGRQLLSIISENLNKLTVAKRNIDKYSSVIVELSNQYNSTIPRVLNRTNWLLDTGEKIMEQVELLDILEYALSSAVLNTNLNVNIEDKYKGLNSDISLVTDKKVIAEINEKMKREQLRTHHLGTKLLNIFEVNQKNAPVFDASCGNVATLFHGTKACNLYGILSTHIKLPTNLGSNIQLTGNMFGSGVYFGEYSKSLQYSTARFSNIKNKYSHSYYLFLCDVALGTAKMEVGAKNYAKAPQGYNSVMGVGNAAFTDGCSIMGINGTKDFIIPKSVFQRTLGRASSLMYNEFIVYNQNRYKIRYIIEVEAN